MSASFHYDGLGNRLGRSVNGQVQRFVLDRLGALNQVLVETDSNNGTSAYNIYGLGLVERISPSGATATFHYNLQGSSVTLTDENGKVTDAYAYDSFGVLANLDGDSPQPFRYLAKYGIIDDRTGLYFARARYFSPQLGRFIVKDPITGEDGDGQSLTKYVYALNNPISISDITGLCPDGANYNDQWNAAFLRALGGYFSVFTIDPAKAIYSFFRHPFRTAEAIAYVGKNLGEVAKGGLAGLES